MSVEKQILERLIDDQKRGLRYHLAFSIVVASTGIIIMTIGAFLPKARSADAVKELITLGGAFVTSLTAFPIKDVLGRREKVSTLRELAALRPNLSDSDRSRVDDIAWKTVEKILAG